MRILILAITAAMLAAGCVTQGDAFPSATTEGSAASADLEASSQRAADENDATTTNETDSGAPAEPPADGENGTAPADDAAAGADEPADAASPAPEPQPWALSQTFVLGWAQALAGPDGTEVHGTTAEGYCPDARFAVPAGATVLRVTTEGQPADADSAGAGVLVIDLTHPDGTVTSMSPVSPDPQAMPTSFDAADPAVGGWAFHARALGPAVNQAYSATVELEGLAVEPPALIESASGCTSA